MRISENYFSRGVGVWLGLKKKNNLCVQLYLFLNLQYQTFTSQITITSKSNAKFIIFLLHCKKKKQTNKNHINTKEF